MFKKVLLILVLSTSSAFAQQPDPAFMQRAIAALQAQRNAALDAQAVSEAKVAGLTEDLNKANLRIKGFEDKDKDNKPEVKPEDPDKK